MSEQRGVLDPKQLPKEVLLEMYHEKINNAMYYQKMAQSESQQAAILNSEIFDRKEKEQKENVSTPPEAPAQRQPEDSPEGKDAK